MTYGHELDVKVRIADIFVMFRDRAEAQRQVKNSPVPEIEYWVRPSD